MTPTFFPNQNDFRAWLEEHHLTEKELIVGFYKVDSRKPSMTWSESVDQALCFGWIDGITRTIDEERYQIRFTPRRKTSIWSAVNIKKMAVLIEKGWMRPAGLAAFAHRTEERSTVYSFENEEIPFSAEFEAVFKANEPAWAFFQGLAPSYRKTSQSWVMTAKQESTRLKRLNELIADCAKGANRWK
jgi:uncharacterized protein YdeI (YjbR/CyaY-like superfamily)